MTSDIVAGQKGRNGRIFKHILVSSFDPESKVFLLQSETSGESRLGVCCIAPPMLGVDVSTVNRLKSVLSSPMPVDSFVQIGLFSDPDVSFACSQYTKSKVGASDVLWKLTEARTKMFEEATKEPLPGMQGVLINRQRLVISMTVPHDVNKDQVKQLKQFVDCWQKVEEGLNAVGLHLLRLEEGAYLSLLRRFFHLYDPDDNSVDEYMPLREQVFAPGDAIDFGSDDAEICFNDGKYYARTLSIKDFPPRANLAAMNMLVGDPFESSNKVKEPYWLSATIYYPDVDQKNSHFRFRHAFTINQAFGGSTHLIPMLRYKKQGFDMMAQELDARSGTLCELNFTMTMFSRDREKLIGEVAAQRAWAATYGFEMREDRRILKALFYTLLPMAATTAGIENLHRFRTLAVAQVVRFLPLIGNWQGSGYGAASLFVGRRGEPVLFDPYESDTNYNGVIVAEAGAGKSVLGQQFLCDFMAGGARAWVIDQGRSYEKLCRILGGQFIEFSETSNICLNPFTHIEDLDEEMDILKAIFAKMADPDAPLDAFRMAALEEKIKAAYTVKNNDADVTEVADQCLSSSDPRVQDIGKQLVTFTRRGTHGRWFNGVNNVDLSNRFVVMELQDLASKKVLQQVVLMQLMASIGHEMFLTHGCKKILLLDEAWALLDDPIMCKAIIAAYRKVRKHDGSAWLITQNIADLYDSPNGRPIIDNAAWTIILQQKAESIDRAVNSGHLELDPYSVSLLKSVHTLPGKYSEMMIRQSGGNYGLVKLITPRFAQILYSTKGWERNFIFDCMAKGENVGEVIDQLVKEGK